MATIEVELLFKLQIKFGDADVIGDIGKGTRSIGGGPGRVEGPQIKGTVELTDWVLTRADGAGEVDVRGTIHTDDGANIYIYYTGILDMSKGGPRGPIRTGIRFETGGSATLTSTGPRESESESRILTRRPSATTSTR